jgi:toxin ParE1/3/4
MSRYSFSDEAVRDLDEICEYIGRNNPAAASQLFDKIRRQCKVTAGFPNMGKKYDMLAHDLRGFIVDNYIIFYYPREDGIDIVRVVSGYRDLEAFFSGSD